MKLSYRAYQFMALALFVSGCSDNLELGRAIQKPAEKPAQAKTLAEFQELAKSFNNKLVVPDFEKTPEELKASTDAALQTLEVGLNKIGAQSRDRLNFDNTLGALDDTYFPAVTLLNRLYFIQNTAPEEKMRDAATEQVQRMEQFFVGLDYRQDLYDVVRAYAAQRPTLSGERAKALSDSLRDYRRAGMELPVEKREQIATLRKELSEVGTKFDDAIRSAQKLVVYKKADLEGVPQEFLDQVKTGEDEYSVMAHVTWHFVTVMENAKSEETRKRLKIARFQLAQEENTRNLDRLIAIRAEIAQLMGYNSWGDYQIEPRMAQNLKRARDFLIQLKDGLQPKFDAEKMEFKRIKAQEAGLPMEEAAKLDLHIWDFRYYMNQLMKQKYEVDTQELKNYFPMDQTLHGMLSVYEDLFGLRFVEVKAPYTWVKDILMFVAQDRATNEPLGIFYLDLYPRPGKYNHFAMFTIQDGKRLKSGEYQRPVVSLVCNFPSPTPNAPSLLSHDDVETLFHEFGHALHALVTRAEMSRYSGTNVARDFVEAPSQMFEAWAWEKKVLDRFAAHYQDPSKKISEELLTKMKNAKNATIATYYRRQIALALADLNFHGGAEGGSEKIFNDTFTDVFFAPPENTNMSAYWGHMNGYDAGYYGYAWSDAIKSDMLTAFRAAPNGMLDLSIGQRMRKEIYSVGGGRDPEASLKKFLGRPWSINPFLQDLGISIQ